MTGHEGRRVRVAALFALGGAGLVDEAGAVLALLGNRDDALYESKMSGRNRVTCASTSKARFEPLLTRCAARGSPCS